MGIFSKKGAHVGKVTGLGGVFFKADDPKRLSSWYETPLGLKGEDGSVLCSWRSRDANAPGMTDSDWMRVELGHPLSEWQSGLGSPACHRVRELDGIPADPERIREPWEN